MEDNFITSKTELTQYVEANYKILINASNVTNALINATDMCKTPENVIKNIEDHYKDIGATHIIHRQHVTVGRLIHSIPPVQNEDSTIRVIAATQTSILNCEPLVYKGTWHLTYALDPHHDLIVEKGPTGTKASLDQISLYNNHNNPHTTFALKIHINTQRLYKHAIERHMCINTDGTRPSIALVGKFTVAKTKAQKYDVIPQFTHDVNAPVESYIIVIKQLGYFQINFKFLDACTIQASLIPKRPCIALPTYITYQKPEYNSSRQECDPEHYNIAENIHKSRIAKTFCRIYSVTNDKDKLYCRAIAAFMQLSTTKRKIDQMREKMRDKKTPKMEEALRKLVATESKRRAEYKKIAALMLQPKPVKKKRTTTKKIHMQLLKDEMDDTLMDI